MSHAGFVIVYTKSTNGLWQGDDYAAPLESYHINAVQPRLRMPPGLLVKILIDMRNEKLGLSLYH